MSRRCILCGHASWWFTKFKFCRACHERTIQGNRDELGLPEGHPFTEARRQRVERMRGRAELGLPIFEAVDPDLA